MGLIDDSSILMSIKQLLNVDPEDRDFNTQIGMFINEEFMTLRQLGIGPDEGFRISDADTKWTDFSKDLTLIDAVKTYIYYRCRLVFDPPASSVVSDQINARINELQWRIVAQVERNWKREDYSPQPDEDPWADKECCDYQNRINYKLTGENLMLFERPTRVDGGG